MAILIWWSNVTPYKIITAIDMVAMGSNNDLKNTACYLQPATIYLSCFIWCFVCSDSGKDLVPSWRPALSWINNDPFCW